MSEAYQVELRDIAKSYKNFQAVKSINLKIGRGEIVSLLGPSGCGKTTTLRMIAGLLEPTEGRIIIAGKDITNVPPYKRDIAMVFQNYALFPHMTVFDNVVYGLRNRGIRDKNELAEKCKKVLNIVQLEGAEGRYPRQLSGGQQQRVSLARALVVEPQVMLFDEPLSNLDAKLREATRIEIRELLKRMNVTAIYVTHDQEEALTISDRIAVMHNGIIEQITTPSQLYTAPSTKFVADFIGHANIFEGNVKEIVDGCAAVHVAENIVIHCPVQDRAISQGEHIEVLVRPENVRLMRDKTAETNVFEGKVIERSFLGSTIRYQIELDGGCRLEVGVHPDDEIHAGENEVVYVALDKDKIVFIKES